MDVFRGRSARLGSEVAPIEQDHPQSATRCLPSKTNSRDPPADDRNVVRSGHGIEVALDIESVPVHGQ
jgi:hypothetical protein